MKGNSGRYRNNVLFDRNLFSEIVPEKSKVKFLPTKVSIDHCHEITLFLLCAVALQCVQKNKYRAITRPGNNIIL